MATKYEMVYEQIKTTINEIRKMYDYNTDSIAFGHLMLKYIFQISNDEAYESMTDGSNDNGVDAIYFEKDNYGEHVKTHFFQFKFPKDSKSLATAPKREEVLKTLEGYDHFTGNDDKFNELPWSELLKDKREEFNSLNSFHHNIWLIRFSTFGDSDNEEIFLKKIDSFKQITGNNINGSILKANDITELHEKSRLDEWPSFDLKYKKSLGVFSDENSSVYHAYISVFELYKALQPIRSIVLEGNVRYYDPKSTINEGIHKTLESDYERFHLLNNGITIVCQKVNDKNSSDTLVIEKGSIINGAQTIGTIIRFMDSIDLDKRINYDKAFVYVKIIKLSNINSLVEDIVFTLNTQNTMKLSYRISNNDAIKDVQKKINDETEYFLEIKKNEFYHKKDTQGDFDKKIKNVIDVEIFIQCFVAYFDIQQLGHVTKTSRGSLFTSDRIEKIVPEVDKNKMLASYEAYLKIMEIVKQYRSYRKDNDKKDIISTLGIDEEDIEKFRFLNTGNFIILFAVGQYHEQRKVSFDESNLVPIIFKLAEFFKDKENISNETKKKENFDQIKTIVRSETFTV